MPAASRDASGAPGIEPERIAPAARAVLARLTEEGHRACLVGGCVRDLLRGLPVADFDVATSAPPERVLELFPRAVPVGLRHGTVMIPTSDGPVDVTRFRAGPRIEDDLAHRDLTVNAMAWDPQTGRLIDPLAGRRDLEARLLRPAGTARDRLAEDPVRALRVARLAAQLGFDVDPTLEPAMRAVREHLRDVARERIRHELEALLVAPHPAAGLDLLRRTGIEAELAPGVAADAAALVAALPPELPLRLAAWLRGTRAESLLPRLRFPRALARRVTAILRVHPVETGVEPERPGSVRRLMRRADPNLPWLFALRAAEIDVAGESDAARARLAAVRDAVERERGRGAVALRRHDLALDGRDVMRILGWPAGRRVGEALAHLTDCILEDPACNEPERLRALLERWAEAGAGAGASNHPEAG